MSQAIKISRIVRACPVAFSAGAKGALLCVIQEVRKTMPLSAGTLAGSRFMSNDYCLRAIEMSTTEGEALRMPLSWARAALQEAAEADRFYRDEQAWDAQFGEADDSNDSEAKAARDQEEFDKNDQAFDCRHDPL